MDERLTLKNGQIFNGHLLSSNGQLFLYIHDTDLIHVFNALIIPDNVQTIEAYRNGDASVITGYSHLVAVREEYGGMISAVLKKPD
jgi:hypothetical protein